MVVAAGIEESAVDARVQVRPAAGAGVKALYLLARHQSKRMAAARAGKREIRHNDLLAQSSMHSLQLLRAAAVVALVAACISCGGKAPPTLYYVLDLPAPAPAADRLDRTAVLMPLRVGRVIGQGRVIYRESPEQVGFYEYHRWAEDPESSVARSLVREVMARGTFASVVPFDGKTKADFILRGELRRLEEVDYDGPVRAAAEIALELVDADTGRVVWSGASSETEDVPASEVRSVVSRMGAAVAKIVKQLSGELDRHVRSRG